MLELRPLVRGDIPAALGLCEQVSWNHVAADWERCLALNPAASLGGFQAGVLKATCTLTSFGEVGWVGTFLVDQSLRGQGCGKWMFEAMLAVAERQGVECLGLDSSDAGRPIYLKYGFQLTGQGVELWTGPNRADAGLVVDTLVPGSADWAELLAFDRACVGVSREAQLRALATAPGSAVRLLRAGTELCAFGFSRPGRLSGAIGPVLARDGAGACRVIQALMADRRRLDGDKAVGLAVLDCDELKEWLVERGFQMRRRNIRMFRPAPRAVLAGPGVWVSTGLGMG